MAKKLLGLVLVVLTGLPTPSFAQDDVLTDVRAVAPGSRVEVVLRDGDIVRARLVRVDADRVVVRALEPSRRARTMRSAVIDGQDSYLFDLADVVAAAETGEPVFRAGAVGAGPVRARSVAWRLGVGTKVEVSTRDRKPVRGKVWEVRDDVLVLGNSRKNRTVSYVEMTQLRRAGMTDAAAAGTVAGGTFLMLSAASIVAALAYVLFGRE